MMQRTTLLMCMVGMSVSAELVVSPTRDAFEAFKIEYSKKYETQEEEDYRFGVFVSNMKYVAESGNPTLGVTKFSDMSRDEFSAVYHLSGQGPRAKQTFPEWDGNCTACNRYPRNDKLENITSYDWTNVDKVVTSIKDQKRCGSCWSFAACADMESVWYLAGHEPVDLAEQELVSCSTENNGCNGGWSYKAFDFVKKNGGIVSESTYPYTSGSGNTGRCNHENEKPVAAKIRGWFKIAFQKPEEDKMQLVLPKVGPFAIGINDKAMQHYRGGIDNPAGCGTNINAVNHIVTIVGFGEENGQKYWKIKNSWGKDWGEHGYYRIVRGHNKCALATDAFHSVY